jgi:RimJ/RimL family protein N-acetyltransferase
MPAAEPQFLAIGERAALGPLRRDLLATYAGWVNDPEVKHGLMYLGIVTPESEERWLEESVKESSAMTPTAAHFTIHDRSDGAPVGTAALMAINHRNGTARFGILLGERRGRGLGADAAHLVLDWGFTMLALHNVVLDAGAWNTRALRAYERAGFREIGRRREALIWLGERHDEVLMDAVAAEFQGSVLRPRELAP